MKTTFMQIIFGLGISLSFLLSSCEQLPIIDANDVMLDSANYYVSKTTGEKITGIIQDKYCSSSGDSILAKKRSKNGIVEEWITYYDDGQVCGKYYMSADRINQKVKAELFNKTGDLEATIEYDEKDRIKNQTEYREGTVTISFTWDYEKNRKFSKKYVAGKQINEQIRDFKDRLLEHYDVDKNGNKIDALRSCGLELVTYKTGYYETEKRQWKIFDIFHRNICKFYKGR